MWLRRASVLSLAVHLFIFLSGYPADALMQFGDRLGILPRRIAVG